MKSFLAVSNVLGQHEDSRSSFIIDWYHNAGVIIFACLSTWFVTLLGGGLGWVLIVMACCGTYYRTSIRRVRRNVRDDLNREFQKNRLESDVESLEWMNSFIVKFWPIYQPVLAKTVIDSVDQVLAGATPGFLDSIRLSTFTLGTKPPRIEHVKTYPKTEDDMVEMDWKFSFIPNDTADLTSKQLKNKVRPKIILEVRVGKGIASKGIPIIVEDMAFEGTMKIKIKLQIPFPHVSDTPLAPSEQLLILCRSRKLMSVFWGSLSLTLLSNLSEVKPSVLTLGSSQV
jgi:Ca2+-dependent lipid-binding protein